MSIIIPYVDKILSTSTSSALETLRESLYKDEKMKVEKELPFDIETIAPLDDSDLALVAGGTIDTGLLQLANMAIIGVYNKLLGDKAAAAETCGNDNSSVLRTLTRTGR